MIRAQVTSHLILIGRVPRRSFASEPELSPISLMTMIHPGYLHLAVGMAHFSFVSVVQTPLRPVIGLISQHVLRTAPCRFAARLAHPFPALSGGGLMREGLAHTVFRP